MKKSGRMSASSMQLEGFSSPELELQIGIKAAVFERKNVIINLIVQGVDSANSMYFLFCLLWISVWNWDLCTQHQVCTTFLHVFPCHCPLKTAASHCWELLMGLLCSTPGGSHSYFWLSCGSWKSLGSA